jgi:hypothetical protein
MNITNNTTANRCRGFEPGPMSGKPVTTHRSCPDDWFAKFSLTNMHKGGLKQHSFNFVSDPTLQRTMCMFLFNPHVECNCTTIGDCIISLNGPLFPQLKSDKIPLVVKRLSNHYRKYISFSDGSTLYFMGLYHVLTNRRQSWKSYVQFSN